jgi:hypothetical protein
MALVLRVVDPVEPLQNDIVAALDELARLLGTEIELVAARVSRLVAPEVAALVLVRERVGTTTRYRAGVGQAALASVAVDLAARHALLRGASPLVAAIERWAGQPGILATGWRREGSVERLGGEGPARDQQDALLEVVDLSGILELDTEVASHRVVHRPPETVALAAEPGHPVVDRLDTWLRAIARHVATEAHRE